MNTPHAGRSLRGSGDRFEYEHAFIQHLAGAPEDGIIPLDVAAGLNAWGGDGWEIVHMEGVWLWQQNAQGASWPESLRGYYVTFRRQSETDTTDSMAEMVAGATEELSQ